MVFRYASKFELIFCIFLCLSNIIPLFSNNLMHHSDTANFSGKRF